MANPFELLKAKVSATNDVLKRKKVGVTIYIKKDAFALRASLPSKDGQSNQNIQQWVSIGLKADQKNIKEAVRLLLQIHIFHLHLFLKMLSYQVLKK